MFFTLEVHFLVALESKKVLQPFLGYYGGTLGVTNLNKQYSQSQIFLAKAVVNISAWNNPWCCVSF